MKVILLNCTLYNNHHGCELVSKQILKLLKLNNYLVKEICYNFENYNEIKKKIINSDFDLALVNGEGTMHGCQEQSLSLLKAVKFIKKIKKKNIILFNSSIEKMDRLINMFKFFSKIYVRDIDSFKYLKSFKILSSYNSDIILSLDSKRLLKKNSYKFKYLVNDSVSINDTEILKKFSLVINAKYAPIRTFPRLSIWKSSCSYKHKFYNTFKLIAYIIYKYFNLKISNKMIFLKEVKYIENNTIKYLNLIRKSDICITGRYHQLILLLLMKKAFVAINSITSKNLSLLKDVGLKHRVINLRQLNNMKLLEKKMIKLSNDEKKNINNYINSSKKKIVMMFKEFRKYV